MQKNKFKNPTFSTVCIALIMLFLLALFTKNTNPHFFSKNIHDDFIKKNQDFFCYESFYADIYFTQNDEDYVDTVANFVDFYAPLLCKDFGLLQMPKIKIIIYENSEKMSTALGVDYNSIMPMGIYYNGIINILSPDEWIFHEKENYIKEQFIRQGPIIHELSHLMTDEKTGGNYSVWLTEGIALYYEYKYTCFEWREDLKQESESITVEQLENNFGIIDESKAYRKSFDIIYNFIEKNGEEKLQSELDKLRQSKSAKFILSKNFSSAVAKGTLRPSKNKFCLPIYNKILIHSF